MNLLRLALIALVTPAALAPQPQSTSIAGIVVDSTTGIPIAGATLKLAIIPTAAAPQSPPYSATTDADGKFKLENLNPGAYSGLKAQAVGYVNAACSTRLPTLAPGQNLNGIRCELTATGAIAGRVVDRNGDPISNTEVQALQFAYADGQKIWKVEGSVVTNDLGEYRLFWLDPGLYYIRETSAPAPLVLMAGGVSVFTGRGGTLGATTNFSRRIASDGTASAEITLPLFYPDTADPQQAMPVEVHSGTTTGVSFRSVPAAAHRIVGRIVGAALEEPDRTRGSPTVELVPRSAIAARDRSGSNLNALTFSASIKPDNTFEFGGVPAGTYDLIATHPLGSWSGSVPVDVRDADLNNVTVAVSPNVKVTAEFSVDGVGAGQAGPRISGRIVLQAYRSQVFIRDGELSFGTSITVNSLETMPPGLYQVVGYDLQLTLPGSTMSRGAYIKSIRVGPIDALRDGLRVDGSLNTPLSIVLASDFGKVSGRVVNASQEPVSGATVALVPDLRGQSSRYASATTDSSGRFQFEEIAPGGYKAFAWESVESGAWQNAEFLAAVENRGYVVNVGAGESAAAELSVISAPGR